MRQLQRCESTQHKKRIHRLGSFRTFAACCSDDCCADKAVLVSSQTNDCSGHTAVAVIIGRAATGRSQNRRRTVVGCHFRHRSAPIFQSRYLRAEKGFFRQRMYPCIYQTEGELILISRLVQLDPLWPKDIQRSAHGASRSVSCHNAS